MRALRHIHTSSVDAPAVTLNSVSGFQPMSIVRRSASPSSRDVRYSVARWLNPPTSSHSQYDTETSHQPTWRSGRRFSRVAPVGSRPIKRNGPSTSIRIHSQMYHFRT